MLSGSAQTENREKVRRSDLRNISLALFFAGVLAGIFHMTATAGFGQGYEMVAIARSLAFHRAFANPFATGPTGPTAVNPPLYPMLLAGLFKMLKNPATVGWVALAGNIGMNALTAALLPRVSFVMFEDPAPGVLASVPWLVATKLMPAWDTAWTVAGLILFCLFSASTTRPEKDNFRNSALAGLAAAALALLNPASLLISLPWMAYLVATRRGTFRAARYCGVLIATLSLILSAWMLRNDFRLGSAVLRTNFGMSVYASNNDCAAPSLADAEREGCYQAYHPNTSAREAQLLRTLGEVAYDRKRTADAMEWIGSHRSRFLRLTLSRIRAFWFPDPEGDFYTAGAIWLITGLSIPGVILIGARRKTAAIYLLAVSLIYPLLYYIVIADVRYRYPALWISALAAGYCAVELRTILLQPVVIRTPGLYRFLDVIK